MKKLISIMLAAVLLLSLCACTKKVENSTETDRMPAGNTNVSGGDDPVSVPEDGNEVTVQSLAHFAADHKEVYVILEELEAGGEAGRGDLNDVVIDDAVTDEEADTGGTPDHSGTNVQVEGVDEGDVVKTDGKYIYVLSNESFAIFSVNGESVGEVSVTKVGGSEYVSSEDYYSGEEKYPYELYISGDRAVVIYNYWSFEEKLSGDVWGYSKDNYTLVEIYDISDRSLPKLVSSLGQDGSIVSTRLLNGRLYAVTSYYVGETEEEDVSTYVPSVYRNGDADVMEPGDICIPDAPSKAYTVAGVYSIADGTLESTKAVLTAGGMVYMDGERLVVAGNRNGEKLSEPRTESVYEVVDHEMRNTTELTVFDVSAGEIEYLATTVVDGYLESQFSMDRHNGYLRLVTTQNTYSYTVYTDKEMGFENVKWHDDSSRYNNLYVLDADMKVVGRLEGLAENERVYSVRFDGDVAYFCTFKDVDPLFTVDLSDPTAPKILSALKIPGFSEYLHVWQEGSLLFGLGQNAKEESYGDETWTVTDGMKLSMFDVSDPANVTEKWKLKLGYDYSEALYNHKAILVSREKNIIAFPISGGYAVYGFSEADGFHERGSISLDWDWNVRGLWIENYYYIVSSERITVIDIENFTVAAEIPIHAE